MKLISLWEMRYLMMAQLGLAETSSNVIQTLIVLGSGSSSLMDKEQTNSHKIRCSTMKKIVVLTALLIFNTALLLIHASKTSGAAIKAVAPQQVTGVCQSFDRDFSDSCSDTGCGGASNYTDND